MQNGLRLSRVFAVCGLAAAATFPAAFASAQSDAGVRSSSIPSYHLMQLSLDPEGLEVGVFKAKTEEVRSCKDALQLARSTFAKVNRDRFVRASSLPGELQDILRDLPTGHATPLFTSAGKVRVMFICNRK